MTMAFGIKLDENIPRSALELLLEFGYDAHNVYEQKLSGCKDLILWEAVQKEKRFLITADKGFADVRLFPPGTHYGILLLRPEEDGIRPILSLLHKVIDLYNLEILVGTITVVTKRGIRVRRI